MKKYTAILMMIVLISLTGCAGSGIALTENENEIIAEYIAGVMLKHDKHYKEKLIYSKPQPTVAPTEMPVTTATPKPTTSTDSQNNSVATATPVEEKYVSVEQIFSNKSFEIAYKGYKVETSYPSKSDGTDYNVEAPAGKKLLIVEFQVKNTTNKKQNLLLSSEDFKYQLKINDKNSYNAAITPLLNDIQYFDMTIEAGKTKNAVLLFEIDKTLDLKQIALYVINTKASNAKALINIK